MADELNLQPTADGEGYRWAPPADLTPAIVSEAKRAEAAIRAAMMPAELPLVLTWLLKLAQLVAGNMAIEDVKQRVAAYANHLDLPPMCFTDATRVAAARKFKFFPSFAELCEFLEEQRSEQRRRLDRLKQITAVQVAALPAPVLTPETVRENWLELKFNEMTEAERALASERVEKTMASVRRMDERRREERAPALTGGPSDALRRSPIARGIFDRDEEGAPL